MAHIAKTVLTSRCKKVAKLVFPIAAVRLSLIENLEAEDVVGETLGQFLPRHFASLTADTFEVLSDLALVRRVWIAFEVLALAFDHEHAMHRLSVSPALHDKIGTDFAALVALN